MSVTTQKFDPETAGNFEEMEKQFAVKTVQHMSVYWNLLEKMPGSKLRLTRHDDEIMEHLKQTFPDFDPAATIDEEQMKSPEGKEKWRAFVEFYKEGDKRIDDYNFGTIVRRDPKFEYGEKETMLVLRMQFCAIEIARNRAGLNDWIYEAAQKAAKAEAE